MLPVAVLRADDAGAVELAACGGPGGAIEAVCCTGADSALEATAGPAACVGSHVAIDVAVLVVIADDLRRHRRPRILALAGGGRFLAADAVDALAGAVGHVPDVGDLRLDPFLSIEETT